MIKIFYDNYKSILHIGKSMICVSNVFCFGHSRVDASKAHYFQLGYLRVRL